MINFQPELGRAAVFASDVRRIQSLSGKKFTGGNYLPAESHCAIAKAAFGSAVVGALERAGDGNVARELFDRFEELCRRRECTIQAELRGEMVELLAGELLKNHSAVGGSANKLVGVTVLQGAIGPDLKIEFECFRDAPSVLTMAAVSYPSDPRAFLRKVAGSIDTLTAEPEFERFRETPWVFITAASNYPSDPRAFLRKVAGSVDTLAAEPEFERFRERPWVFTKAALNYPSDPRAFLRKVARTEA